MKTFPKNNKVYKITQERGDYYFGEDNRGKVECILKTQAEVVEMDSLPKAKKYYHKAAAPVKVDPVQTWKEIALSVNNKWNQNSTWQLAADKFGKLRTNGDAFIESLLNSMFNQGRLSDKQAYYLAKFGVESGQLK